MGRLNLEKTVGRVKRAKRLRDREINSSVRPGRKKGEDEELKLLWKVDEPDRCPFSHLCFSKVQIKCSPICA